MFLKEEKKEGRKEFILYLFTTPAFAGAGEAHEDREGAFGA